MADIESRVLLLEDWRKRQNSTLEKLLEKNEELAERVISLSVKVDELTKSLLDVKSAMESDRVVTNRWRIATFTALTSAVLMFIMEVVRRVWGGAG